MQCCPHRPQKNGKLFVSISVKLEKSMTLSTLIHAGLVRPAHSRTALVLMGGGARTAYQAGVLKALAQMLKMQAHQEAQELPFPFQILVGTSAGALNASFLASRASEGLMPLEALAQFWQELRSQHVYRLDLPGWMRFSRIATGWKLSQQLRYMGALLDNMPLVDTLHKTISLTGVDMALADKHLHALAVTASSYTSGVHWTFCHTARDAQQKPWSRPGRRAEFQPITIEHLMASSAIPLIFPSTPLWVDGHSEFFGDGSMRQTSPLSPALHLGATKVLIIGVGQPERSGFGGAGGAGGGAGLGLVKHVAPGVGGVLGHALASVFHDTLRGDVEQAQRMNETLDQLPPEIAAVLPYGRISIMSMQPTESLDHLARQHAQALPDAVRRALAALSGKPGAGSTGAGLTSYLLFEPEFVKPLMELGERDAYARKQDLLEFFKP
jgi:NTE family protein